MFLLKLILALELLLAWFWLIPMLCIGVDGWELGYISLGSLPLNVPLMLTASYQFFKHPKRRVCAATAFCLPLLSLASGIALRTIFDGPVVVLSASAANTLLFTIPISIAVVLSVITCLLFPRKLVTAIPTKLVQSKALLICLSVLLLSIGALGVAASTFLFFEASKQSSAVGFGALVALLIGLSLFFALSSLASYVGLFASKAISNSAYRMTLFLVSISLFVLFTSPLLLIIFKS